MFLGYIHSYRALAILFILGGHTIDAFIWGNTTLESLLRILISNGSVLFVFIAGYLFQHLSVKYNVSSYFTSKLKNVLIPYFLVSIPAIIVFVFFVQRETVWPSFYDNTIWEQISFFYLTGIHLAPLWFIPFISLIYLLSPLLIWADKKPITYLALPLFIVLSCMYTRSNMPFDNVRHFFSVYLLGMFFSHYKELLNPKISRYRVLIPTAIVILGLTAIEFSAILPSVNYLNYLQKVLMSVFFLGFLIALGTRIESTLINLIANVSFGIFFIHSYILTGSKLTYQTFFGELPEGNLLGYCFVLLFVLIVTTLVVLLVKKLTGVHSKYFVGS